MMQVPLVVLVDTSTANESQSLARLLVDRQRATLIGSQTRQLHSYASIKLLSGGNLYIGLDSGTPLKVAGSRESSGDEDNARAADTVGPAPPAIRPDRVVSRGRHPPLVADLINKGLLFDFVVRLPYESLPRPAEETRLLHDFYRWLQRQEYSFDPLDSALDHLATADSSAAAQRIVARMRQIAEQLPRPNPVEFDDELRLELLRMISDVKVAAPPTVADRLRCGDSSLKQAVTFLEGLPE
jgi:hypothetical protein